MKSVQICSFYTFPPKRKQYVRTRKVYVPVHKVFVTTRKVLAITCKAIVTRPE